MQLNAPQARRSMQPSTQSGNPSIQLLMPSLRHCRPTAAATVNRCRMRNTVEPFRVGSVGRVAPIVFAAGRHAGLLYAALPSVGPVPYSTPIAAALPPKHLLAPLMAIGATSHRDESALSSPSSSAAPTERGLRRPLSDFGSVRNIADAPPAAAMQRDVPALKLQPQHGAGPPKSLIPKLRGKQHS